MTGYLSDDAKKIHPSLFVPLQGYKLVVRFLSCISTKKHHTRHTCLGRTYITITITNAEQILFCFMFSLEEHKVLGYEAPLLISKSQRDSERHKTLTFTGRGVHGIPPTYS